MVKVPGPELTLEELELSEFFELDNEEDNIIIREIEDGYIPETHFM